MGKNKCEICGFDKGIAKHHLIKKRIGGTDEEENLVYLCSNHHWIADFGTEEERKEILNLIKEITGKDGKEIEGEEKDLLEKKIKVLLEESLCYFRKEEFKPYSNEEWEKMKETSNYSSTKAWLLGRGCSQIQSSLLNRRAEILLIINKLKEELHKTKDSETLKNYFSTHTGLGDQATKAMVDTFKALCFISDLQGGEELIQNMENQNGSSSLDNLPDSNYHNISFAISNGKKIKIILPIEITTEDVEKLKKLLDALK